MTERAATLVDVLLEAAPAPAPEGLLSWEDKALELTGALERLRPVVEAARGWRVAQRALHDIPPGEHGPEIWAWGRRHQLATQRLLSAMDRLDGAVVPTEEELRRGV